MIDPLLSSAMATPRAPRSAVFLTHSSLASPFRVGSHQLAFAMGKRGWRILHLPTPITLAHFPLSLVNPIYRTRIKDMFRGLREVAPGVFEWVGLAFIPWQVARLQPQRAARMYAAGQPFMKSRLIKRGQPTRPEILFIDEPRLAGMAQWFHPHCTLYRATDLYHEMMSDRSVLIAEAQALAASDGFIATSQPVFDHLRALAPDKPGLLVENGVDLAHFDRVLPVPPEYDDIPSPRAVYVGAMDDRFDFDAVISLARHRPQLSIVLIGPPPTPALDLPRNIRLLGIQPYDRIPPFLQHATLGLLTLSAHPANQGRSPMKIYEYGASGLPVVAARTRELQRRNLPFVSLYHTLPELTSAIDQVLSRRKEMSEAGRKISARMSWQGKLDDILSFATHLRSPAPTEVSFASSA